MASVASNAHDRSLPPDATSPAAPERGTKGGSGFASLLRSARRKSSESLRSVRSSASRRSIGSMRKNFEQSLDPLPPLPSPRERPSHSESFYSSESASVLSHSSSGTAGRSSRRQQSTSQTTERSAARPFDAPQPLHSSGPQGDSGVVSPTSSSSSSIRPTSKSTRWPKGSSNGNGAMERSSGDGSKTPTGRTTPTQANPYGNDAKAGTGERADPSAPQGGDGNTVAQLYAVFGLPKDPSVWTLAEEDCVAGVHHMDGAVGRFWRPEVLGCSICPAPAEVFAKQNGRFAADSSGAGAKEDAESKWQGRTADGKKGSSNPKFIEMADGRGRLERAETARVLSKALKLSFTREIEVVSGQSQYPPMATSHTFSFSVPTVVSAGEPLDATASSNKRKGMGAVGVSHHRPSTATGEGFGLDTARSGMTGVGGLARSASHTGFEESSTPATFYGVVLTVWSAADERRTKAIKKELHRLAKQRGKNKKLPNGGASEFDEGLLPANNAFFMPYAICIVSRYPLYDLLGDWNKWAWHKYSRNIEMHNKLMSTILSKPAPRLGGSMVIESPDGDLTFSCTFPGALEWGTGLIGVNFTMWPLFKTLSLDNILTVCEIALAPNGRVLFLSRHPALLGLAVESIRYLVELRGWQGVANQNCHARDVRIYLEDPGTWIIAISTELKSIIKPAPAVCIVDLDINHVHCPSPPPGAPSTKGRREKRKKRLVQALGFSSGDFRPPREFVEAYPGGRLRPLSKLLARSEYTPYDELETPIWWDQTRVVAAFDKALHDGARPTALNKLLRMRAMKNKTTSEAELAAILALRKRASTFVDARDGLENKIGRLNKRLAFLMSESEMWKAQFAKIQQLVDRLTREANETRAKLDKERRESRRLSSTLAQRDLERVQLAVQLKEQEEARERAQAELVNMQRAMDSLEHEREAMMDEIRGIISGAGGDDVAFDMSRLELYNESMGHGSSRAVSPTGSQASSSMTPSQAADRIIKARKAAEDRINEGQRNDSRQEVLNSGASAAHASQSGSSYHRHRLQGNSPPGSSMGGNHFPDDQMNYEIQKRTTSVTDQIAKIQAQLESTLNHLEDRSRSHRSRRRRDSDVSYASSHRYEHRAPSSLAGHGNGEATEVISTAHGGAEESEVGYESSAAAHAESGQPTSAARRERRRRREQRGAGGPPSAYKGPLGPALTPQRDASASNPASTAVSDVGATRPARSASREHLGRQDQGSGLKQGVRDEVSHDGVNGNGAPASVDSRGIDDGTEEQFPDANIVASPTSRVDSAGGSDATQGDDGK
ncbi:unnamed protein product [Parajaminaea phylloscopi]